jgi:hypothetical protein
MLARVARLESRAIAAECGIRIRFVHLKRRPPKYQGESHVIIARHLRNKGDQECVEFEEVRGPAPAEKRPLAVGPKYLDVRFVWAHPIALQDAASEVRV